MTYNLSIMNAVQNVIEYYDELYPVTEIQKKFYSSQIDSYTKPVKLLRVGCGTGYLEHLLAREGHDVTGLETSKEMLESANLKRRNQLMSIRFFQMTTLEMTRFLGKGFYNIISCLNDRIIYIHDATLIRKFFFDCKQLLKEDGKLVEKTWKIGGMYGETIEHIVYWLEKASEVAENAEQKAVIEKLISYYRSGDLKEFDEYSILWLKDLDSKVDFVNGFIESYGDPLGLRGSWEGLVNFKDSVNTARTVVISDNAQWFEDHSPIDDRFRKPVVKGVTAKVITAAMLAGDSYPSTAIGINLPNSNWIRAEHGSKSVSIDNITAAYDAASAGNGFGEEFMWSNEEIERAKKFGHYTDNVHTDLHECLGHGSGQLLPGVDPDALKEHGSTLEEARADIFALYYMADPKLIELGVMPDPEAYKAAYYQQMMNGLMTQLVRIEPGENLEEAHMRNRALIAYWTLERASKDEGTPALAFEKKDGKTYVKINDYEKLRTYFGELLGELQRIKSEGDYEAGRQLVENYGVKVDKTLHSEVLSRYAALDLAPYRGFVNPRYEPVCDAQGNITDVKIIYGESYVDQMLRYSSDYSVK